MRRTSKPELRREFGRCRECRDPASGRDGLCRPCRGFIIAKKNFAKRQGPVYTWDAHKDLLLKRAYNTTDRVELSRNISRLSLELKYPKGALRRRTEQLGLTLWSHIRWTSEEEAFLEEHAGVKSVGWITNQLKKRTRIGRSYNSVKCKAEAMNRSLRLREGYTMNDLADLFGTTYHTIRKWFDNQWLTSDGNGRVTDSEIKAFVCKHPEEWYFKRVDDSWLKDLLFSQHKE